MSLIQTKEEQYQIALKNSDRALRRSKKLIDSLQEAVKKCKKQMGMDFEFKRIFKEMDTLLYYRVVEELDNRKK